jgi:crossover junction endodeoxyribonuclease RuvC
VGDGADNISPGWDVTLGVDPGAATCGWGLVANRGPDLSMVAYGALTTQAGTPAEQRLEAVFDGLQAIIGRYHPVDVAVEELFFNRNVRTAMQVSQARGVILLAAGKCRLPVAEYTPLQVKQAVVGYGRAEKRQIQEMVRMILRLDNVPRPDDAADALAVAICHIHSRDISRRVSAQGQP